MLNLIYCSLVIIDVFEKRIFNEELRILRIICY